MDLCLSGLAKFLVVFVETNRRFRMRMDFRVIVQLEEVLHLCSSQSQNEELITERRRTLSSIVSFITKWISDDDISWIRKRALDRAAVYGFKIGESGTVLQRKRKSMRDVS